jgi:hypothetical protein
MRNVRNNGLLLILLTESFYTLRPRSEIRLFALPPRLTGVTPAEKLQREILAIDV